MLDENKPLDYGSQHIDDLEDEREPKEGEELLEN